jgi:hypothetical protein
MDNTELKSELLAVTSLAAGYCSLLENARSMERADFLAELLADLPKLYASFLQLDVQDGNEPLDYEYFPEYVDEVFYDSVRRNVETLLGPDDIFLETFEEDMKYSDTPIAASISECLADIFQPLYNFISVVKESEGEQSLAAYRDCREAFASYWAQTLCNVLRALNHLYFNPTEQ